MYLEAELGDFLSNLGRERVSLPDLLNFSFPSSLVEYLPLVGEDGSWTPKMEGQHCWLLFSPMSMGDPQ